MNGTLLMVGLDILETKFDKYSNFELTDIKDGLENLNLSAAEMKTLCTEIRDANCHKPRPIAIISYIKEKVKGLPGLDL